VRSPSGGGPYRTPAVVLPDRPIPRRISIPVHTIACVLLAIAASLGYAWLYPVGMIIELAFWIVFAKRQQAKTAARRSTLHPAA
jgi:hypothetical protein